MVGMSEDDNFKAGFEAAKMTACVLLEIQIEHLEMASSSIGLSYAAQQLVTTKLAAYNHANRIVSNLEPPRLTPEAKALIKGLAMQPKGMRNG